VEKGRRVTAEIIQLTLDDAAAADAGISPLWQQRAAEFHEANPHVYELLVRYAREIRAAGHDRVGIELLWNRMRWDWMLDTASGDDFKLNQNFKAWYARRIMERERDLADVFETRRRRTKAAA
jgi:hypothetical protein